MGDDLHRDLLPVRENSYVESYRGSIFDPRERLIVTKLNRNDLEDKYLRLFEDYQELRKLYNSQEDKIKRLSTKLMRVCTTPRSLNCGFNNGDNDRDRSASLVLENTKLKEKINILRNQILSHRVLARPSSQNKRLQLCHSSAITSYRSDGPVKIVQCPNFISDRDNNEVQNYITRIKELEMQRKKMMTRICELENKLDLTDAGNQKDKIAENVEYIRVWREMKLQNEKLRESETKNKDLITEIEELKTVLTEAARNHEYMTSKYLAEEKLTHDLKEQVSRSQSSEADLREREEKIRDLSNELKTLQEHHHQIIELSSKNSETEIENHKLKEKLSNIMADNTHLKSAFDIEQGNIASLQAVNTQLREKLQDLQKSVDILTDKLNAFEKHTGMGSVSKSPTKSPTKSKKNENYNDSVLICECKSNNNGKTNIMDNYNRENRGDNNNNNNDGMKSKPSAAKDIANYVETSIQTEFRLSDWKNGKSKRDKACSTDEIMRRDASDHSSMNGNSKRLNSPDREKTLSPEEMLKLLDDAQIHGPSKLGPLDGLSSSHYGINPIRRQSSGSHQSSSKNTKTNPNIPTKINIFDHTQFIDAICGLLKDYWRLNNKQSIEHSAASSNNNSQRGNNSKLLDECKCVPTNFKDFKSSVVCIEKTDKRILRSNLIEDKNDKYRPVICPRLSNYIPCPALSENLKTNHLDVVSKKNAVAGTQSYKEPEDKPKKTEKQNKNEDTIVIRINNLRLKKNCPLFFNPDVQQLYVEFSFLGYRGISLETVSLPIPKSHKEDMKFDYKKEFSVDKAKHSKQRKLLRNILVGNADPIIQFNIVSEPKKDEVDFKECVEVGQAQLNFRNHIIYNRNDNISPKVINIEGTNSIGNLKIAFHGLTAIRKNLPKFLEMNGLSG